MSHRAWAYIWGVYLLAMTLAGVALYNVLTFSVPELLTFFALTTLATIAQLFEVEFGRQSFYPHFVFFVAGVLLLQPFLFVLLVAIPHLIEWAKERLNRREQKRAWYIQPFNIAGHIVSGSAARWAYEAVESNNITSPSLSPLVAAITAALAYVLANHLLIGMALVLARGISWQESGILEPENVLPDFVLSLLGYTVAVLWELNFWLVLPALAPLALMYKALMVPQLKQEAQTDGKTGLWNARHFTTLFQAEMERAKRFDRPLSILMADLDLLRNINNTYGHLAGDTVLAGIGQIIRQTVREYDIAGRFGGEEFAIVLPETNPIDAKMLAERLRAAVEAHPFKVATNPNPITVTMSIGVACMPEDASETDALVHCADVAVYQAKLKGRNCVVCASDVPHFIKMESHPMAVEDRLPSPYGAAFLPKQGAMPSTRQQPNIFVTRRLDPTLIPVSAREEASRSVALVADSGPNSNGVVFQNGHNRQNGQNEVDHETPMGSLLTAEASEAQEVEPKMSPAIEQTLSGWMALVLKLFVGGVIILGLLTTLTGIFMLPSIDWTPILLLVALAVVAELLQVDLYGPGTVSVSVAVTFAAALVGGILGVACVSAAIALVHYIRRKPELYKTAFNWSTHVLAGLLPVSVTAAMGLSLQVENLAALALPMTVASLVYYSVETGLIAGAIALSSGKSWVRTWRERYRWLLSHYLVLSLLGLFLGIAYTGQGPVGLIVFTLPVLMMHYTQRQYVERTEDSVRELQRMNTELTHANQEVVIANRAMQELNEELFLTLSKIIDARDPFVSGHAAKVSDYATAIALEIGMPVERLEPLRQAGFLHDIGKIAISEQVLHKPARLTREEYEYIKTHAALGAEFLELSRGLRHLAPFVRHHHEYWDGHGYPDGLRGEEIELEARILAVCDAAEAMASDRPYRKGMSLEEIVNEIERCAGSQFDPSVASAFIRVAERERERLVINSALAVQRKHGDDSPFQNGNKPSSAYVDTKTGPLVAHAS